MPKYRRPRKYSRVKRKVPYRTGVRAVKTPTRKIARVALRRVNRVLRNQERKTYHYATTTNLFAPSIGGLVVGMCDIDQGDGQDQREGNSVTGMYGVLSGEIEWDFNDGALHNTWARIALVVDRQQQVNSTPTLGSVGQEDKNFLDTAQNAGDNINTPRNIHTYSRYKVLASRTIRPRNATWNTPTDTVNGTGTHQNRYDAPNTPFRIPFRLPRKIQYNGADGTADILKGQVYLMAWSNCTANAHVMTRRYRLWYKDT